MDLFLLMFIKHQCATCCFFIHIYFSMKPTAVPFKVDQVTSEHHAFRTNLALTHKHYSRVLSLCVCFFLSPFLPFPLPSFFCSVVLGMACLQTRLKKFRKSFHRVQNSFCQSLLLPISFSEFDLHGLSLIFNLILPAEKTRFQLNFTSLQPVKMTGSCDNRFMFILNA